ncbi:MAG: hypothetical protein LBS56_01105 [Propionibacteriaceae bacterium]|jgi:type II restriction enzyme|nr:hypothetical protein [Propionibacteriaceae bacterium]
MGQKARLRLNRRGTVINLPSKQQESELGRVIVAVSEAITAEFGYRLEHRARVVLTDIVGELRATFPEVEFGDPLPTSSMSPDGGVLSLLGRDGALHPILISEVKNQGTNDLREAEGLKRQPKGNAIERLGKNVIGFRAMMLDEQIMPFVCFGYGVDFEDGSPILDRVRTIAMFGGLNVVNVVNQGERGVFNRGSFFFREAKWTVDEMTAVLGEVASRAVHYYIAKYGSEAFATVD